jgi:hypothetical protein
MYQNMKIRLGKLMVILYLGDRRFLNCKPSFVVVQDSNSLLHIEYRLLLQMMNNILEGTILALNQ